MKNKRVLLTDGAGLVGSHVTKLFAAQSPREIVVSNDFARSGCVNVQATGMLCPLSRRANISRATERLRFAAELELREGLQHLVRWWRKYGHRSLARVAYR